MTMKLDSAPIATLESSTLAGGDVGLIVSEPGLGKSAVLVHLALEALLADKPVLHVSLRETVEHVRSHYHDIIGGLARTGIVRDRSEALVASERHRVIHSYLDKGFDLEHLEQNLEMLADVAQFSPRLVVMDGFEGESLAEVVPAVRALAQRRDVPIWVTGRGTPADAAGTDAKIALVLRAEAGQVHIERIGSEESLGLRLDPTSQLLVRSGDGQEPTTGAGPTAGDCTLYSGGAKGAEEAFGEACERWGVQEVNFTFDGHKQARSVGRYALSPRELAAGDVSLVYVSRRLNRTYSEGTLIRKVLQTLWHMVSRSQQVFVIGSIQDDGTVVGGTGWSVELARMWNKDLWVFDQEQDAWFQWSGDAWLPGTPRIDSHHFTGAGTRYLTESGRHAIDQLFERSFA